MKKSREVRSHQTGVVVSRHVERVEILVFNVVIKELHPPEIVISTTPSPPQLLVQILPPIL